MRIKLWQITKEKQRSSSDEIGLKPEKNKWRTVGGSKTTQHPRKLEKIMKQGSSTDSGRTSYLPGDIFHRLYCPSRCTTAVCSPCARTESSKRVGGEKIRSGRSLEIGTWNLLNKIDAFLFGSPLNYLDGSWTSAGSFQALGALELCFVADPAVSDRRARPQLVDEQSNLFHISPPDFPLLLPSRLFVREWWGLLFGLRRFKSASDSVLVLSVLCFFLFIWKLDT